MVTYRELIAGCIRTLASYNTAATISDSFSASATIQRAAGDSHTTNDTITVNYNLPSKGVYSDAGQTFQTALEAELHGVTVTDEIPYEKLTTTVISVAYTIISAYRPAPVSANFVLATPVSWSTVAPKDLTVVSADSFQTLTASITGFAASVFARTTQTLGVASVSGTISSSCSSSSSSSSSSCSSCSSSWFVAFYDLSW